MASTLTADEFVIRFHSLSGTTVGERRKNLFLLLNRASEHNLIIDFKQLQLKTPLEENFKLETLIYFENTEELLSLLTSENPILVQKTVKKASFTVLKALSVLTNDELLTFLSQISLNAKLKILNKLGQYLNNTVKAEGFFAAIMDKYGINLAAKLLVACSLEFINNFLLNTRFKLSARQLLTIAKKRVDLVPCLFEILHKYVNIVKNYKVVIMYLARHNVPLFITLRNLYNFETFCIGRRASNSLIQHHKSSVIENAKMYSEILQDRYIKKGLHGEDYDCFYYGLFPPLLTQFEKSYEQILTFTPNLEALLVAFHQKYNTELLSDPKFVIPAILKMMPSGRRLAILKPEYKPADFSDDDWVCYYLNTADAIALLKKRICLTSDIKSRAKLISLLVETCHINKDKETLLEICNYMLKQHRNDHISVRLSFLKALQKSFKFENLEILHWRLINEFIQIFQLNSEDFFYRNEFSKRYLVCCLKYNQPIKEPLVACLKLQSSWGLFKMLRKKPAYEKVCLQTTLSLLAELGKDLYSCMLLYFKAIVKWNKRHPKDAFLLSENLDLVNCLKEALIKNDYTTKRNCDLIFSYVLCNKSMAKRDTLLELYIPHMSLEQIKCLVHSDTHIFVNNLDSCISTSLRSKTCTDSLWLYCKLYNHLNIPQKVVSTCLDVLSQELPNDGKKIKKNALTALSYLIPTANLLSLNFNLGPHMKNCVPDPLLVQNILDCCQTNQLSSVKRTIFSLMNNISETTILQFVLQLLETKNLHVRKMALHFVLRTMQNQTIMYVLGQFITDPDNAKFNTFILSKVFKYFIKTPNDYVWNIIKLGIETLDANNVEAYELVLQPNKIPNEYLSHYIIFMWAIFEKLPDFYKEYAVKLLKVAHPNALPQEFCEALIDKYFLCYTKNYGTFYVALQVFVCKYICNHPQKLEKYVPQMLALHGTTNLKLRSYVNHFIKQMCYECVKHNKKDLLVKFAENWNNSSKPHEMFEEYLYIQLSLIQIDRLSMADIAVRLVHVYTFLIDNYGIDILHPFTREIKHFSQLHFIKGSTDGETEINRFTLIENIVLSNDSLVVTLLGILLLDGYQPNLVETNHKYEMLKSRFSSRPELEIRVYFE